MKRSAAGWGALLATALFFQACMLVPLTGRRQLSLVSDADMLSTSFLQYGQFMKENPGGKVVVYAGILSTHPSDENRMAKIQAAIPEAMRYYKK